MLIFDSAHKLCVTQNIKQPWISLTVRDSTTLPLEPRRYALSTFAA
jgi:hypothetical protein